MAREGLRGADDKVSNTCGYNMAFFTIALLATILYFSITAVIIVKQSCDSRLFASLNSATLLLSVLFLVHQQGRLGFGRVEIIGSPRIPSKTKPSVNSFCFSPWTSRGHGR